MSVEVDQVRVSARRLRIASGEVVRLEQVLARRRAKSSKKEGSAHKIRKAEARLDQAREYLTKLEAGS